MISRSVEFERFLEANYPSAYLKISSKDVKDDVYFTIYSEFEARFRKWQSIPEWIKDFYKDTLPAEILSGNITVDDFIENLEYVYFRSPDGDLTKIRSNNYRNVVYIEEKLRDVYNEKVALGYSRFHAKKLAENAHIRSCMCALCRPLTKEERACWRATRKSDRHIVKQHFKTVAPEKMVFHSIKKYDMYVRKMQEEQDAKKKIEYFINAAKCKYEIFKYLPKVKNENVKRGLLRMFIIAKKQLGYRRMAEARGRIAKYVVAKKPKKKINNKAMADVLSQVYEAS